MKKIMVILFVLCVTVSIHAQQITRFAVVDTARIYTTFLRDSRSVRNYESKKKKSESEIKKLSDEIIQLREKKVSAQDRGDSSAVSRYEATIASKTSFLIEFSKGRNDELAVLRGNLVSDNKFYSRLYDTIQKIAESNGYTMVLNLQEGNSIIWYSPTVDITDDVIKALNIK